MFFSEPSSLSNFFPGKNLAKFVAKIIAMKECCNDQTFAGENFLSTEEALKKVTMNVL